MTSETGREITEEELERLVEHYLAKERASGLDVKVSCFTGEFDFTEYFNFYTYRKASSDRRIMGLFLNRDYIITPSDITRDLTEEELEEIHLIAEDVLEREDIKTGLRNLVSLLVPLPKLNLVGVGIRGTFIDVIDILYANSDGEVWSILDSRSPPTYDKGHPKAGQIDWDSWRSYEQKWIKFYFPIIRKYGHRIADVHCTEEKLDRIKKTIDLSFEMCTDKELDEFLYSMKSISS